MNRVAITALALSLVFMGACSSVSYNHDWDRDADFPNYRTFTWLAQKSTTGEQTSASQAQQNNSLLDKRIRSIVTDHLTKKGLVEDQSGEVDLYVVYHTGLQDKINVTDWGYRYSYDYYGWGGRDIDVYQYTEGTLILDLIDARTEELVWRGSATGTVDSGASPEKIESNINRVIGQMLQKYPPK